MLRKSRSSSCIPVKLHGSAASGSQTKLKNRPLSLSRVAHTESASSVNPKRNSSLDRKSQLGIKCTPSTSKLSVPRFFTPGSVGSSYSSRVSPGSQLKERKTIQKLSTNKNWVTQQYAKVQDFLSNSDLFDPTVVNPNNIKPLSTNVFIYTTSILLKQLFANVKITMENYKEEIPSKLKSLCYPGTVTVSFLKTVNTMHCWPQVIGMFSWLIDKVNLINKNATPDHLAMSEEFKYKWDLSKICTDYIIERYCHYNIQGIESPERIREIDHEFSSKFAEKCGVSVDAYEEIKAECEKKREQRDALLSDINELSNIIQSLEINYSKLIKTTNNLKKTDAEKDDAIKADLNCYTLSLKELAQKENNLVAITAKLEGILKNQSCTYNEKKKMLKNIKTLKDEIKMYKDKMKHSQDVKNEFDENIDKQREMLQSKIASWNRALYEICIKKPEFKSLLIPETGLHKDELKNEICEKSKQKNNIENEVRQKVQLLESNVKDFTEELQNLKTELFNAQENLRKVELEFVEFSMKTDELKKNTKQRVDEWKLEEEKVLLAFKESEDMNELQLLTEENKAFSDTLNTKKEELEKLKVDSLRFFVELHKQNQHNIMMIHNISERVKNQVEAALLKKLEEMKTLEEFLRNKNQM